MVQNEHSPPENIENTFHRARHSSRHHWTLKDLERDKRYTNAFPITNGEQNQEGEPVIRYRYHGYFRLEREKALAKVFLRQWRGSKAVDYRHAALPLWEAVTRQR